MGSTEHNLARSGPILILGGYGAFGSRIAKRLAREKDLDIILAGRNETAATDLAHHLSATGSRTRAIALDATTLDANQIRETGARVLVNAAGPYEAGDYRVARAAIEAGCHAIDLADNRAYVRGFTALDGLASDHGVLSVAGASSVPGLSSAVALHLAVDFDAVREIDIGITPGNRFDPGLSTVASILSYVGRPFPMLIGGEWRQVHGWQGNERVPLAGLGSRPFGYCNVPDLDLMPARFAELATARFRAGLEVAPFHWGLWAASWLVRAGLVRRPERLARPLLALKRRLSFLGSDAGGMFVRLEGIGRDGKERSRCWTLVANSNHGPYVPTLAATILARRLARAEPPRIGAVPCFGLVSYHEFAAEVCDLDITLGIDTLGIDGAGPRRDHLSASGQ